MRELTAHLPKPMIEVRGKPVLQHIVEGLRDAGIRDCLIVVAIALMLCGLFRRRFALQRRNSVYNATVQDWTGRVVDLAHDFVGNLPFFLAYGDILVDPANYKRVVNLSDDVEAMLTVTRGEDVSKGGAVFLNDEMDLVDLREKPKPGEPTSPGITPASTHFAKHFRFHRKIETIPTRRIRTDRCDPRSRSVR
jgi:NDP-sugar pyrophosphorylase family protein